MLKQLHSVEDILALHLRSDVNFQSMYIDYHPPVVERIWFQLGIYRVYLHKIHKCNSSIEALFHPHPWKSAIRIIKGSYETGIGHSATNEIPVIDWKGILAPGSCYEMVEQDAWHYVNPVSSPVYSLMITGEKFERKMPVEPDRKFQPLNPEQFNDIMNTFLEFYPITTFHFNIDKNNAL